MFKQNKRKRSEVDTIRSAAIIARVWLELHIIFFIIPHKDKLITHTNLVHNFSLCCIFSSAHLVINYLVSSSSQFLDLFIFLTSFIF